MGWFDIPFWGQSDPLKDLDPSLRRYLEKESPSSQRRAARTDGKPVPQTPATEPPPEPQSYRSSLGIEEEKPPQTLKEAMMAPPKSPEARTLPKESLFSDGRYADIWKTYRPMSETEEAGKSDQDKLSDIVHSYRTRQAELTKAAGENCADEQWALHDCFRTGGWAARMTMCRTEQRAMDRCVGIQTKFLRALGYMTLYERSAEESERIQMHADTLYQRMLQQEKEITEAKEKGLPIPEFGPMIKGEIRPDEETASPAAPVDGALGAPVRIRQPTVTWESLPPEIQAKYKYKLEDLTGTKYELAKKELEQNLTWDAEFVDSVTQRWQQDRYERFRRLKLGEERMTDKVKRIFDTRDYVEEEARWEQEQHGRTNG